MNHFKFPAVLTEGEHVQTVTAFNADSDTPLYTADSTHPHWGDILSGLVNGDPEVWGLFNVVDGVMAKFSQVTDRISWNGADVLWDGDVFEKPVAEFLSRLIRDGNVKNYTAFARFIEKLEANPNEHSREQAYDWLASYRFQITEDGDVVGFKGLVEQTDGVLTSYASSTLNDKPSAFVNGVPVKPLSQVPQRPGDVVTLPRSEVVHDPTQACRRGLHVATASYASTYGKVHEVYVNPADICSVPTDARGEKVRVWRYRLGPEVTEDRSERAVLYGEHTRVGGWAGDVGTKV